MVNDSSKSPGGGDERGMVARLAILVAAFVTASSALAEPLGGEAVRRLVAGKLFAYSCFDGSRGMGRVYADGSVIGTIQVQGSGPVRNVWLPAGTLHVKGDLICASLKGLAFEPCFNVNRTSEHSFRGSMSGMSIAYCDFIRRSSVATGSRHPHGSEQDALEAATDAMAHAHR
jgi:hypothetical protein